MIARTKKTSILLRKNTLSGRIIFHYPIHHEHQLQLWQPQLLLRVLVRNVDIRFRKRRDRSSSIRRMTRCLGKRNRHRPHPEEVEVAVEEEEMETIVMTVAMTSRHRRRHRHPQTRLCHRLRLRTTYRRIGATS